jgi:uncharacterized protein (TIGR01777 family)
MSQRTFERTVRLPADARAAYEWHTRPGAFERLVPPWEPVRLEGAPAAIVPGARQTVRFRLGPLSPRWTSEITEVEDGRLFRDVQRSGPFAEWEHTHELEPDGEHGSRLADRVRYRLPLGPLGALFGGPMVRGRLGRMFDYRHAVTELDLKRHAAAEGRTLTVLVSGASGLVGSALCAYLSTGGHEVRRLVRRTPRARGEYRWDPTTGAVDPAAVEGCDAVIHLAGENIAAGRWTRAQKRRIETSRVEGTRQVADAVRAARSKPEVFVCASAIGVYGSRGDELLDEASERGDDYLAHVGREWEREAGCLAEVRTVQARFGVILSASGGALRKMLPPFLAGAGGRLGSGRQWMSWIALEDVLGALHHIVLHPELRGPVNVVAPHPVTNADFTRTLGHVLGRPTIAPVPALAVRALFGEMGDALLLASQRVYPRRLLESGFEFAFPDLEGALRHTLGRRRRDG